MTLAPPRLRGLNLVIDLCAIWVLLMILLWLAGETVSFEPGFDAYGAGLTLSAFVGYYYGCEFRVGQTIGQMITRTHVVDDKGDSPTWQQLLHRSVARLFPFDFLTYVDGAGFLHDRVSRTRVVSDSGRRSLTRNA